MFYYCSNQTFLSIIKERKIWLSDMTKSNDYAEIKGYLNILSSVAYDVLGNDTCAHNASVSLQERINKVIEDRLYVYFCLAMCFSSDSDSLSQWRAYGDDGKGVAIGFNKDIIKSFTLERGGHPLFSLREVTYYKKSELRKHLKEKIQELAEQCMKRKTTDARLRLIKDWVGIILQEEVPFFKSEEFQSEKETRLSYTRFIFDKQLVELRTKANNKEEPEDDSYESMLKYLRYRAANNDIIPYIEKDISGYPSIISKIIIGPCNNASIRDVENAMILSDFSKPVIIRSSIPYRSRG